MSLLLKVLRFILLCDCGQDDDERLLIRHEEPTYTHRPLSQTTTPPAVSHPYPTFASPSRSGTFLSSAGRSTQPSPARPPPVPYSSSASANTSSSSATLPSASRSTQPSPARPPPVSYSSSASASTSSSSATHPSASRSTQPPPARRSPLSYSSSASGNPSTASIPSPSAAQSTKPQDIAYPFPGLANQSKSTRLPAVVQSSSSLANPSSTTLPSRAAASPFSSTRTQLAKPPPEACSSFSSYNTSSTTPSQSRAHSSLAPTSKASLQLLNNWKPKQVVLPSPETSHPLKTWKPVNHNTPIKHWKSALPRYEIPQRLKEMIERDIVTPVLFDPLTPSTYADYFACLLYAEDYYIEKWSDFLLSGVTLELRSRAAYQNAPGIKSEKKYHTNEKDFVAFKIDSVPERPPFLLSRDFVFVRPSIEMAEPFKGVLYRVIKRVVLVEFEDDFHAQHSSTKKYDVSFSFNRVCLKRAHHAVSAAKDPSLSNILFPEGRFTSSFSDLPTSSRILNHKGPLPYLLEGPLSTTYSGQLSNAGYVIQDAIVQIYRTILHCRILICAPRNRTCDALMRSLQKEIPQSKLFRANAAFRDYDLVPDDIIPSCFYEGECFTCPPLNKLQNFEVVMSTFISSFRLHNAGITSDHFTHIFLVDASSVTEPEAIVALVDLVCSEAAVVVTGCSKDFPHLIRSDIARMHGLKKSYFNRLLEREPYSSRDPKFITHL